MGDSMAELAHACYPQFSSLNNALNQNPCQIAHTLFQVCDSPSITRDDYTLYELDQMRGQHRYPPPNQWQATECICSMASYNLVQACAACQQSTPINSTLWNDWVSNCTMSNINFGKTFPYDIPSTTTLPNWAYANNARGAFDMGDAFQRMSSNSSSWPFDPSSYSLATGSSTRSSPTASSSSSASTSAYGESNEGTAPETSSNASDNDGDEGGKSNNLIVGIIIPVIVLAALVFAGFIYLRRKKRNLRRQRGFRLGSDNDLPPPTFIVDPSSNPFTDIAAAHPVMSQQKDSRVSLFLPSETVFTRSSHSRSSFTTNSVSTGSISTAPYSSRPRQARLDQDPYGQHSLFTPSTAGYDSRSSAAYTYDDDDDQDSQAHPYENESISPFSDINRPARTLLATRNNLHNTHDSRSRSRSTFYTENDLSDDDDGDETDSVMSRGGRRGLDPDVESLITLSSRVSKLSRRAPSSSGATYGGAHDDDDDDDDEEEYEEDEGEDMGFETEQGEQSGFETERQEEEDQLSIDERDSIDAISLTSTSHRP
ncbi:hypothetical protein JCM5353_001190 [Sporobolomyces roseus]